MLPWGADLAGRIDERSIVSERLRGNPLGDPFERPLNVYLPPGYDDQPGRRYPTVYVIQGYTGHLGMWANRTPFRQPFPETADALFADGTPPVIVVFVDAWTTFGGSQFVDSPAPATTTPTSATRSSRSSTPTTAPSPSAATARSPASPAAASAR